MMMRSSQHTTHSKITQKICMMAMRQQVKGMRWLMVALPIDGILSMEVQKPIMAKYSMHLLIFLRRFIFLYILIVCGLQIFRYKGKTDFWEYCVNHCGMPGPPCVSETSRHKLEPEKLKKYLNSKFDNCKIWDMVQQRAKELCGFTCEEK